MKKRYLSLGLTALCIVSILMLTLYTVQTRGNVSAAASSPKMFTGYIPSAVTSGQAHLVGQHLGTDHLTLALGLPLRNQQALTHLLQEVSTPHNPLYRHYLTQAEANQSFNPTSQQEQQVTSWLQSQGLTVTHTYPNHLLVDVTGTFAQIEQVFHVTINDYTMQIAGKQTPFYAPINEPTVDNSVSNVIDSILGLDNYPSIQSDISLAPTRPTSNGKVHSSAPYYPQDFANAYDVNPLWNAGDTGVGQHIGVVLWGLAPSDTTLIKFHKVTGANIATRAQTYGPSLQVIPVDLGPGLYISSGLQPVEAGMDVESSSGMAPGATIDFYEAPTDKYGNGLTQGLDDALNMAGSDANNNAQISDSWQWSDSATPNGCEAASISDPFIMQTEQILQSNTATGHDYLFSSGDNGSACVMNLTTQCTFVNPYPQYPASSAYVTSVGGTNLSLTNNIWQNEAAMSYTPSTCKKGGQTPPYGSGGGYSKLFAQPGWQAGFSKTTYRGYPDIAADADSKTGAYICYDQLNQGPPICSKPGIIGNGTSLATPLWAGMIADVNQYMQSQKDLPLGFLNPLLYEMAKGSPYTAYHDIMTGPKGTNGKYYTRQGWDEVTGLGSPDLYNLAQDAASLGTSSDNVDQLDGIAAISATDIWAVGSYNDSNGSQYTLIEHWNGSIWNVIPSPNPSNSFGSYLTGVAAVSANDVWAVGISEGLSFSQTLIEHWNGSTWNVILSPSPSGLNNTLKSVAAVSATDIWAVGSQNDSNGNDQTLIEHWNGNTWSVAASPDPSTVDDTLNGVTMVSATDIWAVGSYFNSNGNNYQTLIEQWNGNTWNVVSSPNPSTVDDTLNSVTAISATDVWAVGYSEDTNLNTQTLIEQWNGNTWNVVSSPNPSPGSYSITLKSVATVSATDIWAVGGYDDSNGLAYTLIEQWNGSTWNVVSSPNSVTYTKALSSVVAVSATDIWAVGDYDDSNGYLYTLIEQWNGSTWNVVSSPNR